METKQEWKSRTQYESKKENWQLRDQLDPNLKEKWTKEQRNLQSLIKEFDDFKWTLSSLKYVGGMDLSFVKQNRNLACSYFVVMSYPDFKIVYEDYEFVQLNVPYMPGFLAYREAPHLIDLYNKLKTSRPELLPDVIMLDGNGVLHVNGCGLASHVGVLLDVPTIGVSKTMFYVDGITAEDIYYKSDQLLQKKGQYFKIVGKSKKIWGAAYKGQDYYEDEPPLIISVGHRISLDTAIQIVNKSCVKYCPEPIRIADGNSRAQIRNNPSAKFIKKEVAELIAPKDSQKVKK